MGFLAFSSQNLSFLAQIEIFEVPLQIKCLWIDRSRQDASNGATPSSNGPPEQKLSAVKVRIGGFEHLGRYKSAQGLADSGPFELKTSEYVRHGVLLHICRREKDPSTTALVLHRNVRASRCQSTKKVKLYK